MNKLHFRSVLILAVLLVIAPNAKSQSALPDELTKSSIKEQINYIEVHTKIYDNWRAIREDMYQKINGNIRDSLTADKNRILGLTNNLFGLRSKNDSLTVVLQETNRNLDDVAATKNHIKVFGIQVNKAVYNTIMFSIVAGLIFILAVGFLAFKRNLSTNISTKKELKDLYGEFEAYRQSTRVAREKMAMDHFNEIKKLKKT